MAPHAHGGGAAATTTVADMMAMGGMDMASSTMSMPSSTSTADMSGMDMSGMHLMGTYLTRDFAGIAVLFKNFSADTKWQAFGIFLFIFFFAFLTRALEFFKVYLENVVWNEDRELAIRSGHMSEKGDIEISSTDASVNSPDDFGRNHFNMGDQTKQRKSASLASSVLRDMISVVLTFIPIMLGYGLMLIAMTFSLTYFFAVVSGSTVGKFYFEKLARRNKIPAEFGATH